VGSASINSFDCNKLPLEAKKYVSYVSENVQLYGMFTTRQNLAFFAELAGKKSLTMLDYDDVMRIVGLLRNFNFFTDFRDILAPPN